MVELPVEAFQPFPVPTNSLNLKGWSGSQILSALLCNSVVDNQKSWISFWHRFQARRAPLHGSQHSQRKFISDCLSFRFKQFYDQSDNLLVTWDNHFVALRCNTFCCLLKSQWSKWLSNGQIAAWISINWLHHSRSILNSLRLTNGDI